MRLIPSLLPVGFAACLVSCGASLKFTPHPVDNRHRDLVLKGNCISNGAVDSPAVSLSMKKPVYPPAIHRLNGEGSVVLMIVIDEIGKVDQSEVVYADDQLFADAVTKVMPEWRFKPAMNKGRKVRVASFLTYKFHLYESPSSMPKVILKSSL